MDAPSISIVIPVLNEADHIAPLLAGLRGLRGLRAKDEALEIIVVDGGSHDDTVAMAASLGVKVIESLPGRAVQMNAGADAASGDILLFLHADTRLPDHFMDILCEDFCLSGRAWGRFDVRLSSSRLILRLVAFLMNLRSRLTGICTGDQAIFIRRQVFEDIGGFARIPLMEDIDISKRLKSVSPPFCVASAALTSSRRWEENGALGTIMLMWWIRLRYFMGASPESLAKIYR